FDTIAPSSAIASPAAGASVGSGSRVSISGTAGDTGGVVAGVEVSVDGGTSWRSARSEEHTSELQSPYDLVCRLLLEKKKDENLAPFDLHLQRVSSFTLFAPNLHLFTKLFQPYNVDQTPGPTSPSLWHTHCIMPSSMI